MCCQLTSATSHAPKRAGGGSGEAPAPSTVQHAHALRSACESTYSPSSMRRAGFSTRLASPERRPATTPSSCERGPMVGWLTLHALRPQHTKEMASVQYPERNTHERPMPLATRSADASGAFASAPPWNSSVGTMKTGAYTGTALPFATNKYVEK